MVVISHTTFISHIVHELMMAHTCAHWRCCVHGPVHYRLLYNTLAAPVMHVANNKLKHYHIQMHCIQFKCTCAHLYRSLILSKFMYQTFCS